MRKLKKALVINSEVELIQKKELMSTTNGGLSVTLGKYRNPSQDDPLHESAVKLNDEFNYVLVEHNGNKLLVPLNPDIDDKK